MHLPLHSMKMIFHHIRLLFFGGLLLYLSGCGGGTPAKTNGAGQPNAAGTNATADQYPTYTYEVVKVYPHDRSAFTQGLVYLKGALLESTGLNGESTLRKVDLETGNVLQSIDVPAEYFAEGLALQDGKLFQLTWQNNKCFVYDLETFQKEKEFTYPGEGWGLTTDGHSLIMSDGTDQIRFLDPATFAEKRRITVLTNGQPVTRLNELEYIKGEIYANVWTTDYVVRIDPATGKITGVIDFTGLLAPSDRDQNTDVLNGIAYDPDGDRLFVTGKHWPKLFEVRLTPKK
jgi:glutamine cyclotransferase